MQFLDAVLVFENISDHFGDFFVSCREAFDVWACLVVTIVREYGGLIDVVCCDVAVLAVNMGVASRLFLNQLETVGILPLHVENVIVYSIKERRLGGTGCARG
jgi:hypothetical protein